MRLIFHRLRGQAVISSDAPFARAFTLAELIVVMIIIVTMSVIAMPRVSNALTLHRVEAAANRLAMDLRMAREHAKLKSTSQEVKFYETLSSYEVGGVANLDHPAERYVVDLSAEPYRVVIAEVALKGGATSVNFDAFGVPDVHGSIVIRMGQHQRTVSWDSQNGVPQISF